MIVRKPYAFLIKNFRKIHIVLLAISLFVAYKIIRLSAFINEFMNLGTYDSLHNPISNYISNSLILLLFLLSIGSAALIFLLRYKQKPWKLYLIPFIEYFVLIFVLSMIKNFFLKYTYGVASTDLRLSRDLLLIFSIVQIPAIGIFIMRFLGIDLQRFNFNADAEFLEMNESDREEIEISLDVDTNTFKRLYRRFIRNFKYSYDEHKKIYHIIVAIVLFIVCVNIYKYIFVSNKVYNEGQIYSVNGFSINIDNSYFTDKGKNGEVISNDSNFVVVEFTIKNNGSPRKVDMTKFHLKNGIADYTTTEKFYSNYFSDLGVTYSRVKELERDESINFIVVYKVNKKLNKNGFVLYYQESDGNLRKIKLKVKDVSKVKDAGKYKLKDDVELTFGSKKEIVSFDKVTFTDEVSYVIRKCTSIGCVNDNRNFATNGTYKIMKIEFGSDSYQAKNMIDFLTGYGKIVYKDSSGDEETLKVENSVNNDYYGKEIYLKVPDDITEAKEIKFEFTVRNNKYVYELI